MSMKRKKMGFSIGTHQLTYGLMLAPLAGVSDHPFRHICRRFGAEYTVSEMVSAKHGGDLNSVTKERLRKIYGNGYGKERQDAEKEIFDLILVLNVEIMPVLYLNKNRDHYSESKLQYEVGIS